MLEVSSSRINRRSNLGPQDLRVAQIVALQSYDSRDRTGTPGLLSSYEGGATLQRPVAAMERRCRFVGHERPQVPDGTFPGAVSNVDGRDEDFGAAERSAATSRMGMLWVAVFAVVLGHAALWRGELRQSQPPIIGEARTRHQHRQRTPTSPQQRGPPLPTGPCHCGHHLKRRCNEGVQSSGERTGKTATVQKDRLLVVAQMDGQPGRRRAQA